MERHWLSYKRALIRLLDRPGGRLLLGKIASQFICKAGADGVELVYIDGFWTRRAGSDFFPDSPQFDYNYANFRAWKNQMLQYEFNAREMWLVHYRPHPGDVIIDVGAGRGEDTVAFSRAVGKTGRVIAIEAHPVSFAALERFCRWNGLTNVMPLHLAIMDKPGTVRLAVSSSNWSESSVKATASSTIDVPASTLDDVCLRYRITQINFLKMNIEGAELHALAGMKMIMPKVEEVCVACHDFRAERGDGEQFRTRVFVERALSAQGFTLSSRPHDPRDYVRDHIFGLRPKHATKKGA